jgi:hypothetical protein
MDLRKAGTYRRKSEVLAAAGPRSMGAVEMLNRRYMAHGPTGGGGGPNNPLPYVVIGVVVALIVAVVVWALLW